MAGFVTAKQLKRAIAHSDVRLEPHRRQRLEAIKDYRGRFYGGNEGHRRQPINLVNRQMCVLAAHLTAGNPINDVRTERLEFRAKSLLLQLALGHLDRKLDRARISRRMLLDSFVSPCLFARVGLRAGPELVTIDGQNYDRGQPYYLPISLDDMIYDPAARCDDEAFMMGHRYRVNRERALESGVFAGYEDCIRNLPAVHQRERATVASEGTPGASDEEAYVTGDMVELADIALYDDDIVYMATVPVGEETPDEYLRVDLWEGPERGPFVKREFTPGIDSPFGIPPIAQAREQAELINETVEKLSEQIRNLKTILAYRPGHDDTAKAVEEAEDGKALKVNDPKNDLGVLAFNTVTPGLDQFAALMLNLWNQQTAGIEVLGGADLAGGKKTATEYAGQTSTASMMVADLAREHEAFETEVTKRLAFYLRSDPFIELPLIHRLPGGELVQVRYSPDMMEDEHGDFTYKVRSLSMRAETQDPIIRQRRVIEMVVAFAQVAQVSAATGNIIDFAGTVRVLGREFGIEEIDEIVGDPVMAALERAMYASVPGEAMAQPVGAFGGLRLSGRGTAPMRTGNKQTTAGAGLSGSVGRAVTNPAA